MTRLICILLTLLFSLSGPAIGADSDFCCWSNAAKGTPKWPNTAQEMDDFLKMPGEKIPDSPTTPGRDKTVWKPNKDTKITREQHPYHPDAPDWHKDPHWHLDTPAVEHERFLPGDDIPGY